MKMRNKIYVKVKIQEIDKDNISLKLRMSRSAKNSNKGKYMKNNEKKVKYVLISCRIIFKS